MKIIDLFDMNFKGISYLYTFKIYQIVNEQIPTNFLLHNNIIEDELLAYNETPEPVTDN